MQIKVTSAARDALNALDGPTRSRVLASIRSIPRSMNQDKVVRLPGTPSDVRMRRVTDRRRVLYRITDVDRDGNDEIVVLQIVDKNVAEPLATSKKTSVGTAPDSVRLGRELAAEIFGDD